MTSGMAFGLSSIKGPIELNRTITDINDNIPIAEKFNSELDPFQSLVRPVDTSFII